MPSVQSRSGAPRLHPAIGTQQIDLGLTVTENMDVRRLVIVNENDDAQAVGTKHGDHRANNLS
jgi:hypothetical protein